MRADPVARRFAFIEYGASPWAPPEKASMSSGETAVSVDARPSVITLIAVQWPENAKFGWQRKFQGLTPHGLIFDRLAEISGGVRQETPTANTDKPDSR